MCGVAGQENPADPPSVGAADVVAVDHRPQNFDVLRGDALSVENFPDLFAAGHLLLVFVFPDGELPSVVAQRGGAVDGGTAWLAVKSQAVVGIPFLGHLGVDHDPAFGIGTSGVADAELTPRRRRAALCGDDIRRAHPLEGVGGDLRRAGSLAATAFEVVIRGWLQAAISKPANSQPKKLMVPWPVS